MFYTFKRLFINYTNLRDNFTIFGSLTNVKNKKAWYKSAVNNNKIKKVNHRFIIIHATVNKQQRIDIKNTLMHKHKLVHRSIDIKKNWLYSLHVNLWFIPSLPKAMLAQFHPILF